MKRKNSLIFFIFLLIVNLYFYFIASSSPFKSIGVLGEVIFLVFLIVILSGLFITSFRELKPALYFCYFGLFVASLVMLIFHLFSMQLSALVQSYFVLATLITLLLSLLDFRNSISSQLRKTVEYRLRIKELEKTSENLQKDVQEQKDAKAAYKEEIARQKTEQREALAKQRADLRKTKQEAAKLKRALSGKEREINRGKKETEKQAELKQQYSKTLRNMRKQKKEDEELLVVSADGTKVHRPECVAVRHLLKNNRKLIKDWKTAKKEGYKTCNLCKPHAKEKVILKNNVKYRFVASKESDKLHKASCMLVKNINSKDRIYFKNYKAGLKKGYTACRICISGK